VTDQPGACQQLQALGDRFLGPVQQTQNPDPFQRRAPGQAGFHGLTVQDDVPFPSICSGAGLARVTDLDPFWYLVVLRALSLIRTEKTWTLCRTPRRKNGESLEDIRLDLIIPTDKRKGRNPSLASIYRALTEHEKRQAYPEAVDQAHADLATLQPSTRRG